MALLAARLRVHGEHVPHAPVDFETYAVARDTGLKGACGELGAVAEHDLSVAHQQEGRRKEGA